MCCDWRAATMAENSQVDRLASLRSINWQLLGGRGSQALWPESGTGRGVPGN